MWIEWFATAAFSTALLASLVFTGAATRLDNAVYDFALRIRHGPISPKIVIVAVDAKSLQKEGDWPWPRRELAELTSDIGRDKPTAIAWYFYFAAAMNPADDGALHQAMARTPTFMGAPLRTPYGARRRQLLATSASLGEGPSDSEGDEDGIVRKAYLYEGGPGAAVPRLALQLAWLAGKPHPKPTLLGKAGRDLGDVTRSGMMLIPYVGPPGALTQVSAFSVLHGDIKPGFFKDKLVLIGATAPSLLDDFPTPVSRSSGMPNVEVDGNILNALLTNTGITPAARGTTLFISMGLTWMLLVALVRLGPSDNLLVAAGMAALPLIAAIVAVLAFRIWVPPAAFLVTEAVVVPYWGWRRLNAASGYLADELRSLERSVGGAVLARSPSARPPGGDLVLQQMTLLQDAKTRVSDLRRFVADILANFPDPVLVVDRDGHILTVNQASAEFAERCGLSVTPSSPVQPILARIVSFTPAGPSAWPPPERDGPNARPFTGLGPAGRAYEIRFTATRSAGDEPTGWIIHLADITPLVSAMRQREEALQLLSHDMRSPQSAILATLSHPDFKGAPAALRQRIESHARRTLELADAFVRLAKAESSRYVLEPIDLAHVVQDAADAVWPLAQAGGVKVEIQSDPEAEYVVLADRSLLTRALINLLDNAVKFSPAGQRVICRLGFAGLNGGRAVECQIADHAGGMGHAQRGELFRKFASSRDSVRGSAGIGLGLALVHTVVTRHNGVIDCDSVDGQGSVFTITLPYHDESPASALALAEAS